MRARAPKDFGDAAEDESGNLLEVHLTAMCESGNAVLVDCLEGDAVTTYEVKTFGRGALICGTISLLS
jgi:hypothetical protein